MKNVDEQPQNSITLKLLKQNVKTLPWDFRGYGEEFFWMIVPKFTILQGSVSSSYEYKVDKKILT